jgi:hypothetical protein
MRPSKILLALAFGFFLSACGGTDGTAPGSPTGVSVAAGTTAGTAVVSFIAPASSGSSAITGYTVTASPGAITATGATSPITLTGLTPRTAYTYSVVATSGAGSSAPSTTGLLRFYSVVETFHEPMTQPNDSIFTGTFTFDSTSKVVSNLKGTLTESMTKNGTPPAYGPPMTTVALANQLSSAPTTLGGVDGLLVTTFALQTTNTFDPSGFAPGGTEYYGLAAGAPNPKAGGVGNAYAMIFVNTTDPTIALVQAQIDKLAYADCTAGGMMMNTCMTGTSMMGYGKMGTMMGVPVSQAVTEQ